MDFDTNVCTHSTAGIFTNSLKSKQNNSKAAMICIFVTLFVCFSSDISAQEAGGDRRDVWTGPAMCRKTSSDVLGPYYFPDPPPRQDLCDRDPSYPELPTLIVEGRVLNEACTPLAGAKLEVWQADHDGHYFVRDRCRGYIYSDRDGRYSFSTIHPGKYIVDGAYRPAHVHFRVQLHGYDILVTQMYFQGDSSLGRNDSCTACQSYKEDLVVRSEEVCDTETGSECYDKAVFDIVLGRGDHVDVVADVDDTEAELIDKVLEGK